MGAQATDFDGALDEFERTSTGQLATLRLDSGAFLRLDASDADPDFEVVFTPSLAEFYRTDGQPDRTRVYLGGWISRPLNRGSVTLASVDPLDPNYFAEPRDLELTVCNVGDLAGHHFMSF